MYSVDLYYVMLIYYVIIHYLMLININIRHEVFSGL